MRKRYLQFSIGTLLIVISVFAIWLGLVAKPAYEQKTAVKELQEGEAVVHFEGIENIPAWLRKAVGEDFFRNEKAVDFATNRGLKVGTKEPKASDTSLRVLRSLPDVETLELGNCAQISDAGLEHLSSLSKLTTLYLYATSVRGSGLEHIVELPKLSTISLSRTPLKDSGLQYLGQMQQLTWLALDNTSITDGGLAELASATSLKTLNLRNTAITDSGLRNLEQLEELVVAGTGVSLSGVERFREVLPACHVVVTFGLGESPTQIPLFPPGHRPTAAEINTRFTELGLDAEVATDPSMPGDPIVSLRLFGTKLSDGAVLSLIEHMPKLKTLNIREGLVGDALLEGIGNKPIEYLSLQGTRITDKGLQHVSSLKQLSELILSGTSVTDDGLLHLYGNTKLRSVMVNNCRTTNDGMLRLKDVLPNF